MWAHLLHESAVAVPVFALLTDQSTTDMTLRAAALQLLQSLLGLPLEYCAAQDVAWAYPPTGAHSHAYATQCVAVPHCILHTPNQHVSYQDASAAHQA